MKKASIHLETTDQKEKLIADVQATTNEIGDMFLAWMLMDQNIAGILMAVTHMYSHILAEGFDTEPEEIEEEEIEDVKRKGTVN